MTDNALMESVRDGKVEKLAILFERHQVPIEAVYRADRLREAGAQGLDVAAVELERRQKLRGFADESGHIVAMRDEMPVADIETVQDQEVHELAYVPARDDVAALHEGREGRDRDEEPAVVRQQFADPVQRQAGVGDVFQAVGEPDRVELSPQELLGEQVAFDQLDLGAKLSA